MEEVIGTIIYILIQYTVYLDHQVWTGILIIITIHIQEEDKMTFGNNSDTKRRKVNRQIDL